MLDSVNYREHQKSLELVRFDEKWCNSMSSSKYVPRFSLYNSYFYLKLFIIKF